MQSLELSHCHFLVNMKKSASFIKNTLILVSCPFTASDKRMFFLYFLIDFIPLVQTVSLHLLLLTAQQEHFEFDADEFTVNTIMESSIKLSIP